MTIAKSVTITTTPILFAILFFMQPSLAFSQVAGCRDPAAVNHNPAATVNDGSCTYNTTNYAPIVKVDTINDLLKESSGLQWAGNSLWSFNDSGGDTVIYRIDTASNKILQTVKITGATNVDWEDIAFDGKYLYIGDFGNNANGARTNLRIYKIAFSSIPADYSANPVVVIPATGVKKIDFRYEDQSLTPQPTSANKTKYDCEAMIADGGKIHLFTKNWISNISVHYVINSVLAGTYIAKPVDTLNTGYLVTGADKSPLQKVIVLLGYQNSGAGNHYMHILSDYKGDYFFKGNKRKIDLPNALIMGQAEGIAFRTGKYGYISNEKFSRTISGFTITIVQKLQSFNLSSLIPGYLSSKNDFFRSAKTGTWNEDTTWESSADKTSWKPATEVPDTLSDTVLVRAGHTITITDTLSINKTIISPGATLVANSLLTISGNGLVLKSDSIADARIGASSGTITGNVTVERYIPAQRSWRLLTTPFYSSENMYEAWQESQVNAANYGTHITGGTTANGFDQDPANTASVKKYDPATAAFAPIASTHIDLQSQAGWFLFVRGDRTVDLSLGAAAPATATILRATGVVKTGSQILPVASELTLVGNPFPSAIDFAAFTKNNVADRFFAWDPKRSSAGAFVLFEGPDYMPLNNAGSYTGPNSILQSGQAFFVQGAGNPGTLTIPESSKTAGYKNVFRTNAADDEKLQVNLYSINADTSAVLADATAVQYNNSYSKAVTSEDAGKPENIDENIAAIRNGRLLTVERRPLIIDADTIFLKVFNMKVKNYRFEVLPLNFTSTTLTAYLEDSYLKKITPLSLNQPTVFNFGVTADTASATPYRFRIVYRTGGALPLHFTAMQGRQENQGIKIEWKLADISGLDQFVVKRSTDGRVFTNLGSMAASQNISTYSWLDNTPVTGNNFYQVLAVSLSGNKIISNIINVKTGDTKERITVYPNPVTGKTICLQLQNQPKGNYLLQLFDDAGRQVLTKSIKHPGGSATQTVYLGGAVSRGAYSVQINNTRKSVSMLINVE